MSITGLNDYNAVREDAKIETSRKLRIGIIGAGWIADFHMLAYKNQPDAQIVAVADLVEGKAEAFLAKHGVEAKCYRSHKEMLDD